MPQSLDNWLASLGLEEYADVFRDNAVDEEVLPELAESDLEKLGVKLGHRKKLLKAITSLSPQSAEPQVNAAPGPADDNPVAAWERMPGERKPVTLLFADITGSTALTEKLDSEMDSMCPWWKSFRRWNPHRELPRVLGADFPGTGFHNDSVRGQEFTEFRFESPVYFVVFAFGFLAGFPVDFSGGPQGDLKTDGVVQ